MHPEETAVVDVLDEQTDLIAVPRQHDPRRSRRIHGGDDIPMPVGVDAVGERRGEPTHDVLHRALIPGRTGSGKQLLEKRQTSIRQHDNLNPRDLRNRRDCTGNLRSVARAREDCAQLQTRRVGARRQLFRQCLFHSSDGQRHPKTNMAVTERRAVGVAKRRPAEGREGVPIAAPEHTPGTGGK